MPTYDARAIVLKKTKLGEADLIITLLASDGRELRAVAKSARKPTSRLGARVEPFTVLEGQFATGRNLDVISDVRAVDPHASLREDYDKLLAASVVAEMLAVVAAQDQATERLYQMATTLFDLMDALPADKALPLLLAWMLKLFAVLGYRPLLEECAVCGRPISLDKERETGGQTPCVEINLDGDKQDQVLSATGEYDSLAVEERFCWSAEAGGVICATCGAGQFIPLDTYNSAALAWLRTLFGATFAEVAAFDLSAELKRDLFRLIADFAQEHFPARLKSLTFLQQSGTIET